MSIELLDSTQRRSIWDHCSSDLNVSLLESELTDLWIICTASCRAEIKRLERLLAFQERGRIMDAKERNKVIAELSQKVT